MNGRMRVAVVMGGPSAENEISLLSGREVLRNLDTKHYERRAVVVSEDKQFFYADIDSTVPPDRDFAHPEHSPIFHGPFPAYECSIVWQGCDVAFLALHGSFGEDGVMQGYLETLGIAYTGSGVYASAVAMNKIAAKVIFEQFGLTTPPYTLYGRNHPETTVETVASQRGFPCFVKCPQSGSSRLMGRAENRAQLTALLDELSAEADELLIESAISGIEFSCPVLHLPDGTIEALPPIEIRPKTAFFDFEAKYTDGGSEEIVPAPQSPEIISRIQHIAIRADAALSCKGVSRTDMILNGETFYVLEINTLPGMTPNSLVPKSFAARGGSYSQLLDLLIRSALRH